MIKQLRKELKERVEKMIERHGPGQMPPERVCEMALDLLMETAFTKEHDPNMLLGDFMTLLYGPPPTSGLLADLTGDMIHMILSGPGSACTFTAPDKRDAKEILANAKSILTNLPILQDSDPFLRAKRAGQQLSGAAPRLARLLADLASAFAIATKELVKVERELRHKAETYQQAAKMENEAKLVARAGGKLDRQLAHNFVGAALRKGDENATRQIRGARQRQDRAEMERDAACRRHGDEIIAHGKTHERLIRQREQLRLRDQELTTVHVVLEQDIKQRDAVRDLCGGNANAFQRTDYMPNSPSENRAYHEGAYALAREVLKAMTSPPDNPLGYSTIVLPGSLAAETMAYSKTPPETDEPHCQPLPPIEDVTKERTGPVNYPDCDSGGNGIPDDDDCDGDPEPDARPESERPSEPEVLLTLDEASEAIKVALRSVGYRCDFVPQAALAFIRELPR